MKLPTKNFPSFLVWFIGVVTIVSQVACSDEIIERNELVNQDHRHQRQQEPRLEDSNDFTLLGNILPWSDEPTPMQTDPMDEPTLIPTAFPTKLADPTQKPTPHPSANPTTVPTTTSEPTSNPTPKPTPNPTPKPTPNPTPNPTPDPTSKPTSEPTRDPTSEPTRDPTSKPTRDPTRKPTRDPTREPTKTPQDWWNYDPASPLGPRKWDDAKIQDSEYFDWFNDKDNQCDGRKQSPVDVRDRSTCRDDHNFYSRRGDNLFYETVKFDITPSSLRLNLFISKSMEDNARADFSNSTPKKVASPYVEIKIPSEHTLKGRRYAAEYHIAHTWDYEMWGGDNVGRMVFIAVLLDDRKNKENPYVEEYIREWEEVAWKKEHECARKENPSLPPYKRRNKKRTPEEMLKIWGKSKYKGENADWDAYALVTTIYYCGYQEGSITVPPCTEEVWWRVLDIPLDVSKRQIRKMTALLKNRLGDDCKPETKMYEDSVARPIQKNRNKVWCCDRSHWRPSDPDKWRCQWPKNYHSYYC